MLRVDLDALTANYAQLCALAPGSEGAAVVKADAYGTGAHRVSNALHKKGCRTFFVATLAEGISLRARLKEARIYVLDGLFPGTSRLFAEHRLSPVLGSLPSLEEWSRARRSGDGFPAAALHIDTGMNRLGLGPDEIPSLLEKAAHYFNAAGIDLVMSHLACADDPDDRSNQTQSHAFGSLLQQLPPCRASLANSAGIFLGKDYHHDLLRPGIALYGGRSVSASRNSMRPVVHLTSHIAQVRTVKKGVPVGYGGAYVTNRKTRLATVPVGYADGYLRALGSTTGKAGASTFIADHEAPVLGRISMDLITIDVTDLPPDLAKPGTDVELLGSNISVDDLADIAGTIGYEILTSLGNRYDRHYTESD